MDDSSSDSDADERLKNLKKSLIRSHSEDLDIDEKYVHKRKLGDLIFDANFEGGNLCHVRRKNSFEYELTVRPDITNPLCHSWFNFTVSNQQVNQCVFFTIINLDLRSLSLFHQGLTPVVRSKSTPNWIRLQKDQVFYYSNDDDSYSGQSNGSVGWFSSNGFVLSIAFRFKAMEDKHQFALFYPYTHSTLTHFINRWDVELKRRRQIGGNSSKPLLGTPELCVTELGTSFTLKSIYLIEFVLDSLVDEASLVVIVCRRSGNTDSNVSLVCQGMMDFLLGYSQVATAARRLIKFAFLPLLDPDSICAGNSESDLLGQINHAADLLESNPIVYGNLIKVKKLIEGWCKPNKQTVLLELAINTNLIGSRILGSYYENSSRMEAHLSFARLLSLFVDGFQVENCLFRSKPPTFISLFNSSSSGRNVNHYLFEISPFAYYGRTLLSRQQTKRAIYEEYDQVKYMSVGVGLVYSLLDLLKPIERTTNKGSGNSLESPVKAHLNSFHQDNRDIDDLLLMRQTCGVSKVQRT